MSTFRNAAVPCGETTGPLRDHPLSGRSPRARSSKVSLLCLHGKTHAAPPRPQGVVFLVTTSPATGCAPARPAWTRLPAGCAAASGAAPLPSPSLTAHAAGKLRRSIWRRGACAAARLRQACLCTIPCCHKPCLAARIASRRGAVREIQDDPAAVLAAQEL
jgi:hypothetical protein